ncbi:MAG TPA: phosphatidylcholine/phosphatidylserine synthase [Cryptosporangiaceae bacterium]|nr:phosphatidylcholine/phosphatidylserine synthase [Cryptosporangiaceae bacterium]
MPTDAVLSTGSPTVGPELAGPAPGDAPEVARLLTGEPTASRRRRFIIVNACTVASLVLGVGAIFAAMAGHVPLASAMLLACVAFDGLDGALARRLGVSTPFGAQMDSLADMCSFGIATPVVAYAWLAGSAPVGLVAVACGLVVVCAAIRLARFNVSPENGHYFSGVPTTMAAAIIVATALLQPEPRLVFAVMVGVLALAMVSTFPYFKVGQLRRVPFWLWPVGGAAAAVDAPMTLSILVGAYLLSGPLLWARQRRGITAV